MKNTKKLSIKENKDKKVLLILGGFRVGDTFHVIPCLNKLKKEGYKDIFWVSGTYEKEAVQLLSKLYDITCDFIEDDFPQDLNSRKIFKEKAYKNKYVLKYKEIADVVIDDIEFSFDIRHGGDIPYSKVPEDKIVPCMKKKEYCVVHLDSCSKWKRMDILEKIKFPLPVVCLGKKDDLILPNSINFKDKPLEQVIQCISNAKFFIGIHSSMACLSFYLPNVKAVVSHFCDTLLNFSDYNKDFIDFKGKDLKKLQKIVNTLAKGR